MLKTRHLAGLALTIALVLGQVVSVAAAPQLDPLVGTIDSISQGTDSGGNTVIIVNYTDTDGAAQTTQLSVSDAESLGLISVDPITGDITILGTPGTPIDLTTIQGQADPCAPSSNAAPAALGSSTTTSTDTTTEASTGGDTQPVAGALCEFFQGSLGVSYDTIMGWHQDGFGFGVITQALFMAENLGVDPGLILDAKKSGDYSGLGLPDGVEVNNWGQFKKFVLQEEVKSLTNLGSIMSGRAQPSVTETPTAEPTLTVLTSSESTHGSKGKGQSGEHGRSGEHGHGK